MHGRRRGGRVELDSTERREPTLPHAWTGLLYCHGPGSDLTEAAHRRHRWRRRAADERVRACHPGLAESCQLDVVAVRQRYLRSLRFEADGDELGCRLDCHGQRCGREKRFM